MGLHERVLVIEGDGPIAVELETAYLEDAGHVVVEKSYNLPGALASIEEAKRKGATVAVVDLAEGKHGDDHRNTLEVVKAIREQDPRLPVIVHSFYPPENFPDQGIIFIHKGPDTAKQLAKAVSAV